MLFPVSQRPTIVRHEIIAAATLMSLLLYLDRFAVGIATTYIREDLRMSQTEMSWFLSAFFWSYALGQVPAGWLSDRFGARFMLTGYILAWSVFTGLLGYAQLVWMVLLLRLLCGVSQAGAYPTAGGLIRIWFPISARGVASSIVALGGRAGGVLAPILTAWLIVLFSDNLDPTRLESADIIDLRKLVFGFQTTNQGPRSDIVSRIYSTFPADLQTKLTRVVELQNPEAEVGKTDIIINDLGPELVSEIQISLQNPRLFDGILFDDSTIKKLKLAPEAVAILNRRHSSSVNNLKEAMRLNRLLLESAFRGSIKQFRGHGWRPTMIAYGLAGVVVAICFYCVARDLPSKHPWVNSAELNLIHPGHETSMNESVKQDPPFPLVPMLFSVSLWGNSLMQLFTNIGWVFVVTWLPRYLEEIHGVSLKWMAIMTAIPTGAGIVGMYLGGWWTDLSTRYTGQKWGRRLPVLATRFTAAMGYGICLLLSVLVSADPSRTWLPWCYVAALCLMAFSVDMGNPAVWGYAQDVGGKYTGSVLGWANMWGNLGAAIAPLIYNAVLGESPTVIHWSSMFAVCFVAFVISGLFAILMDSTTPLAVKKVSPPA